MLEKIVADMPRITPEQIRKHILSVNMGLKIAEDQCRLLAEQGWRKSRTWEEVDSKLVDMFGWEVNTKETKEFYKWLEGE